MGDASFPAIPHMATYDDRAIAAARATIMSR
jgi:hypothetical protein